MLCSLLTTIDNPFDPFENPDEWLKFDMERNYKTAQLLAKFAITSDDYTEEQNQKIINDAIDFIVESPLFTGYCKVSKEIEVSSVNN